MLLISCSCTVVGCLDIDWRDDGEPCQLDEECYGVCHDGVCHGTTPFPCGGAEAWVGQPCLRPEAAKESNCSRAVRAGTWQCTAGASSTCSVQAGRFRDIANGCNDDNLGPIDETDLCHGGLERGVFDEEGILRSDLQWGVQLSADYGEGPSLVEVAECSNEPSAAWNPSPAKGQVVGWTHGDACHPLPNSSATGDLPGYSGRWMRWILPPLLRADDAFTISVLSHRVEENAWCDASGYRVPSRLHMLVVRPDGQRTSLALDIDDKSASRPGVTAPCVPLARGVNIIYVFAYQEEGCPCDNPRCAGQALISPETINVRPVRLEPSL